MFPCLLARINFVKCLITDKWRVKEVIFSNLNSLRQTRHFQSLVSVGYEAAYCLEENGLSLLNLATVNKLVKYKDERRVLLWLLLVCSLLWHTHFSMHILHTFPKVVLMRICWTIEASWAGNHFLHSHELMNDSEVLPWGEMRCWWQPRPKGLKVCCTRLTFLDLFYLVVKCWWWNQGCFDFHFL